MIDFGVKPLTAWKEEESDFGANHDELIVASGQIGLGRSSIDDVMLGLGWFSSVVSENGSWLPTDESGIASLDRFSEPYVGRSTKGIRFSTTTDVISGSHSDDIGEASDACLIGVW